LGLTVPIDKVLEIGRAADWRFTAGRATTSTEKKRRTAEDFSRVT